MIEKLQGTHEIVVFEDGVIVKLYDNHYAEDYPMHWHLPLEIVMPVQNGYGIRCGTAFFDLREKDILLIQPGVLHECAAPDSGRRFFCQISIPAPLISKKTLTAISHILPPTMLITPELDAELHRQIHTLLSQVYSTEASGSLLSDFTRYMRVLEIIHLAYSFFEKNNAEYHKDPQQKMKIISQLREACDRITENYADEITLDSAARNAGFSKYHFSRLFRAYTGTTFYHYVNTVRMSNARIMLTDPLRSITTIAYAVGFSSMSSFIRMFKVFYGCTPSTYRQMLEGR